MNKLELLISKCNVSVTVGANEHRGYYATAERDLYESADMPFDKSLYKEMISELDISDDVAKKIIELNELYSIQFYPRTPVSFYIVRHYSLSMAVDKCLAIIDELNSSD